MSGNCGKNSHSDAKPKEILSAGSMAHRQPPHTACQAFRSEKKELNIFVSIGRVTARENETTGVNQQDSKLIYKTPQDAAQLISKCQ